MQRQFLSRLGSSQFQYFSEKKLVFQPEPDPNKKVETRKPTRTRTRPDFGFESGRVGSGIFQGFLPVITITGNYHYRMIFSLPLPLPER